MSDKRLSREQQIAALEKDWAENPRWKLVKRGYSAADVVRLRGSLQPEYTLAKNGAEKLWEKVNGGAKKGYVNAFGAITAGQAMQQAKAGLEAVYLSGWQVAADGNTSETMYPDQSLYAYDSVPTMVRRINNTFKRADEIQWSRGINPGDEGFVDYFLPIVADAEAGLAMRALGDETVGHAAIRFRQALILAPTTTDAYPAITVGDRVQIEILSIGRRHVFALLGEDARQCQATTRFDQARQLRGQSNQWAGEDVGDHDIGLHLWHVFRQVQREQLRIDAVAVGVVA